MSFNNIRRVLVVLVASLIGVLWIGAMTHAQDESAGAKGTAMPTTGPSTRPGAAAWLVKDASRQDVTLEVRYLPQYVAGHESTLILSVTNNSKREVRYGYSSRLLAFKVQVSDNEAKTVPLTVWGKMYLGPDSEEHKYVTRMLKPAEALTLRFNMARYFDLTVTGKYTASVEWGADPNSEDKDVRMTVQKLEFEIVEPD